MSDTVELIPETVISRNEGKFLASRIGEEIVMMNIENGDYLGINRVGTDLWEKLTQPRPVKALIDEMKAEYNVDPVECEKQCYAFIRQMIAENMILVNA